MERLSQFWSSLAVELAKAFIAATVQVSFPFCPVLPSSFLRHVIWNQLKVIHRHTVLVWVCFQETQSKARDRNWQFLRCSRSETARINTWLCCMRKRRKMQISLLPWIVSSKVRQVFQHISQMRKEITSTCINTEDINNQEYFITTLHLFSRKEEWKSHLKLLVRQMQMQIPTPTETV